MKNTDPIDNTKKLKDDLLPEYHFDYDKARPNRFATQLNEAEVTVTLDSDVARVFKNSDDVNKALRALLSAIPKI